MCLAEQFRFRHSISNTNGSLVLDSVWKSPTYPVRAIISQDP